MQRERWPEMFIKGETRDLQVSKEGVRKMLARSMQMYEKVWGLQLPAVPAEATDADTRSRLPIANAPGQLTLVGVVGAALLDAGGELTKDSMKLLQPLLDDFTAARINVTGPLVKQILKDIEAYDEEYAAQVASAPDGTLERLAASAAIVKQQQKDELAMEVVVEMARDAAAPPATTLWSTAFTLRALLRGSCHISMSLLPASAWQRPPVLALTSNVSLHRSKACAVLFPSRCRNMATLPNVTTWHGLLFKFTTWTRWQTSLKLRLRLRG